MKTTHGPWFARDNGHFWEVVVSPDEFARSVADVPVTVRQPNEEAEKVARLLASAPDLLAERDRLKALNAELAAALETLFKEEAPAYHDCTDNGESECAWCMASAALAKQKETT